MSWVYRNGRERRPDKQSLFVVNYHDGSRAFLRVPPELARFGASPSVMRAAEECQRQGELPPGQIAKLVRVR